MSKIFKYIKEPWRAVVAFYRHVASILPDRLFLKCWYRCLTNEKLNLSNPQTFNDKLNWLKLYDTNPTYTDLVDKIKVKAYVANTIGIEYVVPLIGSWKNANDIDFDNLPERFVLKCNHDSASVFVCKNKEDFKKTVICNKLNKSLKNNFYKMGREKPYKNIDRKILCEEYIDGELFDYKFYCFNGEPKFLYIATGLAGDHSLKIDFYDLELNQLPFYRTDYDRLGKSVRPPNDMSKLIEMAKSLSKNIPFVRIDFMETNEKTYFAEFTFSPSAGALILEPKEYNKIIGDMLNLSIKEK